MLSIDCKKRNIFYVKPCTQCLRSINYYNSRVINFTPFHQVRSRLHTVADNYAHVRGRVTVLI